MVISYYQFPLDLTRDCTAIKFNLNGPFISNDKLMASIFLIFNGMSKLFETYSYVK